MRGLSCVLGSTMLVGLMAAHPGVLHAGSEIQPGDALGGASFVGVWTSEPSTVDAASLDELGVGWARLSVQWSTVQPGSGDAFDWTALDQSMALARGSTHRRVLALVRDNPTWAAATRCTVTSDAERQNLSGFMGALATRYKGVVWQLYNEADNTDPAAEAQSGLGGCFGTLGADGTPTLDGRVQYARTIEVASAAIRAVDPTAQLAAGGVASGNFTDQGAGLPFDRMFLPGVLAQLKQDASLSSLDYVAVHYYSSQSVFYTQAGTDLLGRLAQLSQDSLAAGLDATELKPVISDELSYTGSVGTSTSDPKDAFNLAQTAYVPKLFARSAAADVRMAFWFLMQDAGGGLGADNPYGLKDVTGTPKPAYRALLYFTSQIARLDQFVRTLDLSAIAAPMEGYEFTGTDGGLLQLVWTNQIDASAIPQAYVPGCPIAEVRDALGEVAAFNAAANSLLIGPEPRYIRCGQS
jgi:hypothetical protein